MSDIDWLIQQSIARQRGQQVAAPAFSGNPFGQFDQGPGYIGGFLESAVSSIPELFGTDPSREAIRFRQQNPVSGFVSQVIPTLVPYGGMYALSRTATGAAALAKGMSGVKRTGAALGMNVVDRPVIAGAVKEMLRYSPLELGRLGVGVIVNPDNAGELFADVALSTAFAGVFGGVGGYLRSAGTKAPALGTSRIEGQMDMFAHPVVDLRASRLPEAKLVPGVDDVSLEAEQLRLTKEVLNDKPVKGYLSKELVPLVSAVIGGTEQTAARLNALLKPNRGGVKERQFDKRKLWEGAESDATTLNPGELQPIIQELGFQTPSDLAENVLAARVIKVNSERAAGSLAAQLNDPAIVKVGDDVFQASTDTGATFLLKRVGRPATGKVDEGIAAPSPVEESAELVARRAQADQNRRVADELLNEADTIDNLIAGKPDYELVRPPWGDASPTRVSQLKTNATTKRAEAARIARETEELEKGLSPAMAARRKPMGPKKKAAPAAAPTPTGPIKPGEQWLAVLTDRPGAFVPEMAKLHSTKNAALARMRRMFQPTSADAAHVFNQADDTLLRTVTPLDVARMSRQSRKTWVAETVKSWGRAGMKEAGLQNNFALQSYADHLYDIFAPAMFKERRNSLYARYSGLLTNRLRVVSEHVNEAIFGREAIKQGRKGTLGRNFERQRINDQMAVREAVAQLTDEEFDLLQKAAVTQTPAAEIAKLTADGVFSEQAVKAISRLQEINAEFMQNVVLPSVKSLGEKGNFDLLEGYIIPRILLGDWRMPVTDSAGRLVYLASGKSRGAAEKMAKAIVAEAEQRGLKFSADKSYMKHAVEMDFDKSIDLTDLMEDIGRRSAEDPQVADIVQSAMKRLQFANIKREAKMPFRPRTPGSLAHERTGVKATETTYTREEFIKAYESHIRKMGNFAAIHSFMERWGNEVMLLRGQNETLYKDLMRRAQQAMGIEGQITRVLNNILAPVLGPQLGSKAATKIAAVTNKTLYNWQLAFVNPTFALLNALSPLQTVLPQLAFVMRAPSMEANRLLHHIPMYGPDGKPIGQGAFLDPIKILWESVRQLRHADEELQHLHVRLRNDNTLHPMLFEEATHQLPETLKEAFQSGGWVEFLAKGSTAMARKSEEFARLVSANAGYLVGKHQLRMEGEQLYHFTKRFVESTNYLYGQSDRARIITGPVGSMFGLFKNWQMHFMGMMAVYAGLAIKQNVWSPLVWQMATASTLGGLGATPLRHLADGLANFHDEHNDSFLWMQENWGRPWADMAWFGPMGALGLSLQASASIPGTDVRNDLQMIFSSVTIERAKQLGKAIGGAWSYGDATGENPLTNPNIRDQLIAAAAPRAISRAASVVEGDYVKSMGTGYPMVQDTSYTSKVMFGLGLNAVEIERHQVAARKLFKSQEARKHATTQHGKAYATAIAAQDWDMADRVLVRAMASGLDIESVMRSSANFERREEGDLLSRYKTESAARYGAALAQ